MSIGKYLLLIDSRTGSCFSDWCWIRVWIKW